MERRFELDNGMLCTIDMKFNLPDGDYHPQDEYPFTVKGCDTNVGMPAESVAMWMFSRWAYDNDKFISESVLWDAYKEFKQLLLKEVK